MLHKKASLICRKQCHILFLTVLNKKAIIKSVELYAFLSTQISEEIR